MTTGVLLPDYLTVFIGTKIGCYLLSTAQYGLKPFGIIGDFLTNYFQIDCMMWGALFAVLYITDRGKTWLTHYLIQAVAYILLIGFALKGYEFRALAGGILYWDIYALLAALLLYNLVQPTSLLNIDYRWLSRLGTWSYGAYMLHMPVIWVMLKLVGSNDVFLYPLVFSGVTLVSWLSYTFYEKPFLHLKKRFTIVQTSTEAILAEKVPL